MPSVKSPVPVPGLWNFASVVAEAVVEEVVVLMPVKPRSQYS